MLVITFLSIVSVGSAQSGCLGEGMGPCLNDVCGSGLTCVSAIDTCCATQNLVFTATDSTTTTPLPTCVDQLNPRTGVSDCPARASLCNDAVYYSLMTAQCPRTCGRCGSRTYSSLTFACIDKMNPSTGTSDCPARADLCTHPTYSTLMAEQCPFTCGKCNSITTASSAQTCVDKVNPMTGTSDCPFRANLCTDSIYSSLMTEQCPRTCGKCATVTHTSSTQTNADRVNPNTGISDCPALSHLCDVGLYYSLMTEQCPTTCGRSLITTTPAQETTGMVTTVTPITTNNPSTTGIPFVRTLGCEEGWSFLLSTLSCYKVGHRSTTFDLATSDCMEMGANVATIHSLEENNFVTSFKADNDVVTTTDGTAADYVNFGPGEPNSPAETCVAAYGPFNGGWFDSYCTRSYIYVCKKHATVVR